MLPAQDGNRQSWLFPIGAGADSPPIPLGIDDDDLLADCKQLFGQLSRGIAFPGPLLCQNAKRLRYRFRWNRKIIGNVQFHFPAFLAFLALARFAFSLSGCKA